MIRTAAFATAFAFAVGAAQAAALAPQEAQAVFRHSQEAMSKGDLDGAASDLRRLLAEAPTPRVKLELARLLLAKGDNGESYRLFKEVYDDPATPVAVRMNISPMMEKAELMVFRLRHGVRIASDSNPSKVSDGGTIYFNGVPMQYQAPAAKKTAYGLEPYVSAEKMWKDGTLAQAYASARLFEDPDLVSGSLHLSLGKPVPGIANSMATVAVDTRFARNGSYMLPSVDVWKRFRPAEGVDVGFGGQAGYLRSVNEGVSGWYSRPYAFARAPFLFGTSAFANVSLEHLDSRNDYYTYYTPKVEFGLEAKAGGLSVSPKVELSKSFYPQYDAFWRVKRKDTMVRPSVALSYDRLSYGGYAPEVTFFYEKRDSNIFINEYDQFGAFVNLKKLF